MRSTTYNAHETNQMRALHGVALASFGRRSTAFLLDLLIGVLPLIAAAAIFLIVSDSANFSYRTASGHTDAVTISGEDVRVNLNFFGNWLSVIWWVVYFGLTTYFGKGRSPGKRLLGIRVVSLAHPHLSFWHSFERALGYGASLLEFGFGFFQYFVHPNHRTVHDRIAETIVIDDRASATTR
jgi:uncharacterized RDD family membrane protein YckC